METSYRGSSKFGGFYPGVPFFDGLWGLVFGMELGLILSFLSGSDLLERDIYKRTNHPMQRRPPPTEVKTTITLVLLLTRSSE